LQVIGISGRPLAACEPREGYNGPSAGPEQRHNRVDRYIGDAAIAFKSPSNSHETKISRSSSGSARPHRHRRRFGGAHRRVLQLKGRRGPAFLLDTGASSLIPMEINSAGVRYDTGPCAGFEHLPTVAATDREGERTRETVAAWISLDSKLGGAPARLAEPIGQLAGPAQPPSVRWRRRADLRAQGRVLACAS